MKNTKTTRCSQHILADTPAERLAHFTRYLTNHKHLDAAYRNAMDAINRSTGPRVVIVAGPSGVGKTTLGRRIYGELVKAWRNEAENDRGFQPVAGLSAVPPNGTNFNWKDFYIRLLTHHGDVLIDRKLPIQSQQEIFADAVRATPYERSVVDTLRRSVENSLKQRRTKVLIIDEAHHLLMVKDSERLEYQFEALKSLTIETGITIVMFGTYRLLDIRDQSGQLVRRSEIVHLPRYDIRNSTDRATFASLTAALLRQLPLEEVPDLRTNEDMEYLYTKTGGCVGILKDWLAKCLEQAIKSGAKTLTIDDLEKYALCNKALRTIIEEAMAGERKLEDEETGAINSLLHNGLPIVTGDLLLQATNRMKTKRRVGVRMPVRDPVGGSHHVAP